MTQEVSRNKSYLFTESFGGPSVSYALGTGNGGTISFTLNSLLNVSSYSSLFDQYRIIYAKVKFFPTDSLPVSTGSGAAGYPPIYTVLDYDDSIIANTNDLSQYGTLQVVQMGQYFERTLTPLATQVVYNGALATSSANLPSSTWIDIASPNVTYYGVKFAVPPGPAVQLGWTTIVTLHVQFRNTR